MLSAIQSSSVGRLFSSSCHNQPLVGSTWRKVSLTPSALAYPLASVPVTAPLPASVPVPVPLPVALPVPVPLLVPASAVSAVSAPPPDICEQVLQHEAWY
jgi:hypothetical protein